MRLFRRKNETSRQETAADPASVGGPQSGAAKPGAAKPGAPAAGSPAPAVPAATAAPVATVASSPPAVPSVAASTAPPLSADASAAAPAPGEPVDVEKLRADIITVLRTVFDPEIPVNIYEIGLIYELNVSPEGDVAIRMTLTSPMCPVAETL